VHYLERRKVVIGEDFDDLPILFSLQLDPPPRGWTRQVVGGRGGDWGSWHDPLGYEDICHMKFQSELAHLSQRTPYLFFDIGSGKLAKSCGPYTSL